MNDKIEEKNAIPYKGFVISTQRLYPKFSGWWAEVCRGNKCIWQTNWAWFRCGDNKIVIQTETEVIKIAKEDIDNEQWRHNYPPGTPTIG